MRYISLILLMSSILFSCASVPEQHERPAVDGLEIHKNPKVGDYAILEDKKQGFKNIWRVNKVMGDEIEVSFIFEFVNFGFTKKLHFIMISDRAGKVLRARFHYDKDDQKPQPVATYGGEHSRTEYKLVKVPGKMLATTPSGTFPVTEIVTYNLRDDAGFMSVHNHYTLELSPKVPFKMVNMFQTAETTEGLILSALNTAKESLQDKIIPINAFRSALNIGGEDSDTVKVNYTLTEFGFAN